MAVELLGRRMRVSVEKVIANSPSWSATLEPIVSLSIIDRMKAGDHPECATYFYYLGVRSLFKNDRLRAWGYFVKAKELGYDDRDRGRKLAKHLDNLDEFRKKIEGDLSKFDVISRKLEIEEESLRSILTTLTNSEKR